MLYYIKEHILETLIKMSKICRILNVKVEEKLWLINY